MLKDFTFDVVKKVVELLYFREINVTPELKGKVMHAVKALKISDIQDPDEILPKNGNYDLKWNLELFYAMKFFLRMKKNTYP